MKKNGFTLIEVMVVVTILSILAGIGYQSYNSYIITARRQDGIQSMIELQQEVENHYTENGELPPGPATHESKDGFYTITYTAGSNLNYTITATAKSGTSQNNDTGCETLTLDNTKDIITPEGCD